MPVYCGDVRSHNVRASSGKRSKKAHSRSRCRKVAGKDQADARCSMGKKRCVVTASANKRFNPHAYGSQRGGASECAGKPRDQCLPPCAYRAGPKRQFCSAVGKRGPSKKVVAAAAALAEVPAYERAACLKLSQEMCDMEPNCQWTKEYARKDGKKVSGRCGAKKGVRQGAVREGPMGPGMYGGQQLW